MFVCANIAKDLEVFVSSPGVTWRWDVVSLGGSLASEILFQHLTLPLINIAGLAFNTAEAFSSMSDAALTQVRRTSNPP